MTADRGEWKGIKVVLTPLERQGQGDDDVILSKFS